MLKQADGGHHENAQKEPYLYLPKIPSFQKAQALPGVGPTPTSAKEGCIAFTLLNESPEPTLGSRGDLQGG